MGSWASYRIGVAIDDAMEQQLTVPAVVLRTTVDGADTRTQLAADPENDDAVTLFLSVERHQSDEGAANVDDDTAPVDSSTEVQEHKIRLDWPSVAKVEELVKYVREQVPGWSAELLNGDGTDGLRPASDLRHFSSAQVGSDGLVLRVSDARHPGLWNFHISVSSGTWKYIIVTALGVLLSFTRARNLEGAGASKMGSLMIYLLVACIGASANFARIVEAPALILMGAIWIATHIGVLLLVAWLIKAPIFFVAVGSQANIGGAASAPVVASAFHPSLAPVGALLAVAGYVLGTYAGLVCMQLLKMVSDSGTLPPG
ncbi:MAG: DUF819 family protein [bacterium]|nr:DUF819 family protein [bacterium]